MTAADTRSSGLAVRILPTFSIVAATTYFVVMGFGVPTFIYYPQVGEWHLARHQDLGPPMFFYGWLLYAGSAGLSGAGIAAALPPRLSLALIDELSWLSWLVPFALTGAVMFFLKSYFGL